MLLGIVELDVDGSDVVIKAGDDDAAVVPDEIAARVLERCGRWLEGFLKAHDRCQDRLINVVVVRCLLRNRALIGSYYTSIECHCSTIHRIGLSRRRLLAWR